MSISSSRRAWLARMFGNDRVKTERDLEGTAYDKPLTSCRPRERAVPAISRSAGSGEKSSGNCVAKAAISGVISCSPLAGLPSASRHELNA